MLKKVWGYSTFRPNQEELILGLLKGQDVFGVMPTGGGKSLCYQLPAILSDGCAIVISPLIALMKDQVDSARALGIRAGCLTSHSSAEERNSTMAAYRTGNLDLLYCAPERLSNPNFQDFLRSHPLGRPCFFAVDEAHCLSEWGHDFRPDYLVLTELKKLFPDVPLAAYTATATPQVAEDIRKKLHFHDPLQVRASFDRQNLFYEIRARSDADRQLMTFLREQGENKCGIIYRTTRKSVEETATMLKRNGLSAQAYHAGLAPDERTRIQEDFINDRIPLIVATVAFGMGIDKPDVRFVIHYDLPKTIEGYYQETGRAGRDGDPSHCLLLYNPADVSKQGYLIDLSEDEEEKKRNWALLRQMDRYASTPTCRRAGLLHYFGEHYPKAKCGACDYCQGNFKEVDATYEARVILSAIARTKNRFGANHICDIVTGANTTRIREFKHTELKTYALGKGKPKKYWRRVIDALITERYLVISDGQYPVPQMTATGGALMKGEGSFSLKEDLRIEPSKGSTKLFEDPDYDKALFEVLKRLRLELADQASVPPFVIFSDRTLRQIAAYQPKTEEEFAKLHGVGKTKVEKYASPFISELTRYLGEHPEATSTASAPPPPPAPAPPIKRGITNTFEETYQLYKSGKSIAEMAEARGAKSSTIVNHLCRLRIEGKDIDLNQYVTPSEREKASALIEEHGGEELKPAYEAGNQEISYDTLRMVRTLMQVG